MEKLFWKGFVLHHCHFSSRRFQLPGSPNDARGVKIGISILIAKRPQQPAAADVARCIGGSAPGRQTGGPLPASPVATSSVDSAHCERSDSRQTSRSFVVCEADDAAAADRSVTARLYDFSRGKIHQPEAVECHREVIQPQVKSTNLNVERCD